MEFVRKAHKWIALILGLQLALWMLSGLGMAILPHDKVSGDHRKATAPASVPLDESVDGRLELPSGIDGAGIRQIRLTALNGRPVFETATTENTVLSDALSGLPIVVDEALALEIAGRDYAGPGEISTTKHIESPTLEIRRHTTPAWRVNFNDLERTSIYVSSENGQIIERRNHYWRVFDVFWMLHIMDYQNRSSFNNPLIIISSLVVFWLGISGIILWWDSFRRQDFNLMAKWRGRKAYVQLSLIDREGSAVKSVNARPLQSLYAAMEEAGYPLPSSCGGGGTCGLCRVRLSPGSSILTADRRQIPDSELDAGYRLACQHRIQESLSVALPHGLLEAKTYYGEIVSSTFIAPDMSEIRIALPEPLQFRAGSYIQIEVPPFKSSLSELNVTDSVRSRWLASNTLKDFGTDTPLHRTYSLANFPGELGRDLLLNVRLALAKPDALGVPVGIGSAYLATLSAGEAITLRGPFGDFHVSEEEGEMIFIGGGAGVAPLRSMIHDQLLVKNIRSKISFWYGARTLEDIVYKEEFEQLAAEHSNFSWHVALSELEHNEPWRGERGWIHDVVRDQYLLSHPDIKHCRFYVCGPPPMLTAVLKLLESLNVPQDKIAFDDFGI